MANKQIKGFFGKSSSSVSSKPTIMDLVTKAKEFATHAHRNHFRNDDVKTPYVKHLKEVAGLLEKAGATEIEIAAGWLHDTIEDTDTTLDDIKREFGEEVARLVNGLTDLPEWLPLPLLERKKKQAERAASENKSIKLIKLTDQTSNVKIVGSNKLDYTLAIKADYLEGAKQIAEACKGISPFLDEEFITRYEQAKKDLNL